MRTKRPLEREAQLAAEAVRAEAPGAEQRQAEAQRALAPSARAEREHRLAAHGGRTLLWAELPDLAEVRALVDAVDARAFSAEEAAWLRFEEPRHFLGRGGRGARGGGQGGDQGTQGGSRRGTGSAGDRPNARGSGDGSGGGSGGGKRSYRTVAPKSRGVSDGGVQK